MDRFNKITDAHKFIPHRPPFLFVDSAEVDEYRERIKTEHSFRPDEPYFAGHFPGDPIVPGVVLIECMAQACRLLINLRSGRIVKGFLVGLETAKFLSIVRPNQTVTFDCRLERVINEFYTFRCSAMLDDVRCARGHLTLYHEQEVMIFDGRD